MIMMINSSADDNAIFLPEWFSPSERDVICGWARQNHRHAGNQRFRRLVEHSAPLYVAAKTKLEKTQVIASVVDKVRRDSPGGGFVKRDFHSGLWFEIGDDKARDKVGHAIRRAIEDNKKQPKSSKSSEAKVSAKLKRGGSGGSSSSANDDNNDTPLKEPTPTPTGGTIGRLATLDDFDAGEAHSMPKGIMSKGFDYEGKLSSPFLAGPQFQDKSDSLVVPSFLYQQAAALSNMQQQQQQELSSINAIGQGGHGLNLQQMAAGGMFDNPNNAQLLDVLNNQQGSSIGRGSNDIQDLFSNMNQLNAAGGLSGKISAMKSMDDLSRDNSEKLSSSSFGNVLNQQKGGSNSNSFLSSLSAAGGIGQAAPFALDQMNPFGNHSAGLGATHMNMNLNTGAVMRNNSHQVPNLESLMQLSGGTDMQFGLSGSVLGGGGTAGNATSSAAAAAAALDGSQLGSTNDGLLGSLTSSAGLGFLPSLGNNNSEQQHHGLGRGSAGGGGNGTNGL